MTDQQLTGKPYEYTGKYAGLYQTRHDAIGAETVAARDRAERLYNTSLTPAGYRTVIGRVYAYKPHICTSCHRTFLYELDLDEHQPCPLKNRERDAVRTHAGDDDE